MLRAPSTTLNINDEARRRLAEQMQVPAARTTTSLAPRPMSGAPRNAPAPAPAAPQVAVTRIPGFEGPRQPPAPRPPMVDPRKPPAQPPAPVGTGAVEDKGTPAIADDDAFDAEVRRLLMDRLRKQADTTEAEKVMREQMERELGAGLVNQRARAGRAGFGASGALAAMEGDTMRAARGELARDIVGLRASEDQRALDNALAAIGADTDKRRAGTDNAITQAILAMLGLEEEPAAGGGEGDVGLGFVGGKGGVWNPITDSSSETPVRGAGSDVDPKVVDTLPAGATAVPGRAGLYQGTDGLFYRKRS